MSTEVVTTMDMYWITRLSAIREVLGLFMFFGGLSAGLMAVAAFIAAAEENERAPTLKKWALNALKICVASTVLYAATPTTKEMVAIIVVPKIANNEDVQGLGADAVTVAREWLEELRPKPPK